MNCIIIDDEFPAREELKYFINNFSKIEIIDEFDNPLKALGFLQEKNVDIIFLDINMPSMDGMTLGKILSKFQLKPKIIFITAYENYAVEAFSIDAFDYILKPYSEDRIKLTLKKLEKIKVIQNTQEEKPEQLQENLEENYDTKKLTLWKGNKMYVIPLNKISYIEACERESKVYTPENVYIARQKISDLDKKLTKYNFFRSHRSYIVNLDKITEIIPWFNSTYNLNLNGIDTPVPVSRNKIKEFKKLMGIN